MPLIESMLLAAFNAMIASPFKTLQEVEDAYALFGKLKATAQQHIADSKPTFPDSGVAEALPDDAPKGES